MSDVDNGRVYLEEVIARKNEQIAELERQCDDSDRELQDALNHLATIKEKARAAVQYDDILDMRQALRELEEELTRK